jgi:hypothetical protein
MAVYSRPCTGTTSHPVDFEQSSQESGYHSGSFQTIASCPDLPRRSNNGLQLQGVLASTMAYFPCLHSKQRRGKNTSFVGAQMSSNVTIYSFGRIAARCFALWIIWRRDVEEKDGPSNKWERRREPPMAKFKFEKFKQMCPSTSPTSLQAKLSECLRLQKQRNRTSLSMLAMPHASSARRDSFMISKKESPPKRKSSTDRV